ncbi:MAG TPA: DUF2339 domain-containing protein, partial [bacterium]
AALAGMLVPRLLWELSATATVTALGVTLHERLLIVGLGILGYAAAAAAYRLARFRASWTLTETEAFHFYAVLAGAFLTFLVMAETEDRWLSLALAMDGMAILAIGFRIKDRPLRVLGLLVFALLVLKILFVDLAGAETMYRMLSFLVAGVVLLLASFAYARFESAGGRSQTLPEQCVRVQQNPSPGSSEPEPRN